MDTESYVGMCNSYVFNTDRILTSFMSRILLDIGQLNVRISEEVHTTPHQILFTLEQSMRSQKGSRGIAVLFSLTSTLDRSGGQLHASAALPSGKDPVPIA